MTSPRIVTSFLGFLVKLGIPQKEIARLLGCSQGQVSHLCSGERTLPLEDFRGLLVRLCRDYPTQREQLAEAAVAPILAGTGLRLQLVVEPPPAAPAGTVIDFSEWRSQRELRRAA